MIGVLYCKAIPPIEERHPFRVTTYRLSGHFRNEPAKSLAPPQKRRPGERHPSQTQGPSVRSICDRRSRGCEDALDRYKAICRMGCNPRPINLPGPGCRPPRAGWPRGRRQKAYPIRSTSGGDSEPAPRFWGHYVGDTKVGPLRFRPDEGSSRGCPLAFRWKVFRQGPSPTRPCFRWWWEPMKSVFLTHHARKDLRFYDPTRYPPPARSGTKHHSRHRAHPKPGPAIAEDCRPSKEEQRPDSVTKPRIDEPLRAARDASCR